jgi:hypothetical protein
MDWGRSLANGWEFNDDDSGKRGASSKVEDVPLLVHDKTKLIYWI